MTVAKQKVRQTCKTQQIKAGTKEKFDDKLSGDNDGGFITVDLTFGKTNITGVSQYVLSSPQGTNTESTKTL